MRKPFVLLSAVLLLSAAVSFHASAADAAAPEEAAKEEPLRVGDAAPSVTFVVADADGAKKQVGLESFRGKKNVLLAFYPKAFTPGCTKQLCGYRDEFSQFKNGDTEVFAISVEPQEASDRFKKEYKLPFNVVGDEDRKIVKAYKVPVREHDGNSYAKRSVFLIDKQGVIRHIDLDYDIEKDKQNVYDRIAALNKPEGS